MPKEPNIQTQKKHIARAILKLLEEAETAVYSAQMRISATRQMPKEPNIQTQKKHIARAILKLLEEAETAVYSA